MTPQDEPELAGAYPSTLITAVQRYTCNGTAAQWTYPLFEGARVCGVETSGK